MLKLTGSLLLAGILSACAAKPPIDNETTRREAAARYVESGGGPQDAADLVDAMTEAVPENLKPQMRVALAKVFASEDLNKLCVDVMVKHLTTQELDAMTAFHSSPHGKSASSNMEKAMTEFMPALMARMQQALKEELKKNKSTAGTN